MSEAPVAVALSGAVMKSTSGRQQQQQQEQQRPEEPPPEACGCYSPRPSQEEGRPKRGGGAPEEAEAAAEEAAGEEDDLLAKDLLAKEELLTKDVHSLLETMNRTSSEVNNFERQLSEAQSRHRQFLEQLSRIHEELRAQYGSALDRARPYFDAAEALTAASTRVNNSVRTFSAAASQHGQAKAELRAVEERLAYGAHRIALDSRQQDGLSRATVRVLRAQTEKDAHERDYARALREYQAAQEAAETRRAQVGDSTIRRALPCFKKLQHQQRTLDSEQKRINALAERAKAAKSAYNHCMSELDRINVAVHEARREHLAAARQRRRGQQCQAAPEMVPEVTQEDDCDEEVRLQEEQRLAREAQKRSEREWRRALGADEDEEDEKEAAAATAAEEARAGGPEAAAPARKAFADLEDDDGPFS